MKIEHIDGDPSNNDIDNLKVVDDEWDPPRTPRWKRALPPVMWANDQRFTLSEFRQGLSLRIAGCRCYMLPLFGSWLDGDVWRIRCRLCNTHGRAKRKETSAKRTKRRMQQWDKKVGL